MELKDLQKLWHTHGNTDPLWAILSDPAKKDGNWDRVEFFKTGESEISQVIEDIRLLGINIPRHKALDFGCGVGRLTQALCQHFEQCCGVDIAPSMIELARQFNKYGDRCRYYVNESDDLNLFEDGTFDLIYSCLVLQHMEPQYSKNYISEFIRILAPGGLAIFQLPSELIAREGKRTFLQRMLGKPSPKVSSISEALPDDAFKAQITLVNPPNTVQAGSQRILYVRVRNTSHITWPQLGAAADGRYQVKLGNRWLDEKGNIVVHDDCRIILPRDVPSKDEVEVYLAITAPDEPGRYVLVVDMMQEGVAWFENKGSRAAKALVTVAEQDYREPGTESGEAAPAWEMHGVPRYLISKLIEQNGGKIVHVQENSWAGKDWVSFRYFVTK